MAAIESNMVPLGTPMPAFELPEVTSGDVVSSDVLTGDAFVVMFLSKHCPYVQRVEEGIVAVTESFASRNVVFIGISSNDAVNYPDDAPEHLAEQKVAAGFTFPYLHDDTQDVARAFNAACTPDFFVYNADRNLAYRGQLDAARPGNDAANDGADLAAALFSVLAGVDVPEPHLPSIGCSIKWKA